MREYNGLYEFQVKELRDKVNKLNKRAKKIGCPELTLEITDEYVLPEKEYAYGWGTYDERNYITRYVTFYDVTIDGETPSYDGWYFVAVITGFPDGQNIIHKSPFLEKNVDVTEYRNKKSFCDHCKTRRFRKHTYILGNQDGELIQVGSTCIKDFLGHPAPTFSHFSKIIDFLEEDPGLEPSDKGSGRGPVFIGLKSYLKLACEVVERYGFTSKKAAWEYDLLPTVSLVNYIEDCMSGRVKNPPKEYRDFKVSDESKELAENVIEWGKSLAGQKNLSDYHYNLSVIFSNDMFDLKSEGIVVSAIQAYKKHIGDVQEKKSKFNPKDSEYFGEVKKRYTLDLTLDKQLDFESQWGKVVFHVFHDDDGNQFVWYANGTNAGVDLKNGMIDPAEIGDKIRVKGTVKKHNEYNGIKQTVLNRVKTLEFIERANNNG